MILTRFVPLDVVTVRPLVTQLAVLRLVFCSRFQPETAGQSITTVFPDRLMPSRGGPGLIVMPKGSPNPEIRDTLTVAPESVYSPMVPLAAFAINRSLPEIAMALGSFVSEISDALMVDPS